MYLIKITGRVVAFVVAVREMLRCRKHVLHFLLLSATWNASRIATRFFFYSLLFRRAPLPPLDVRVVVQLGNRDRPAFLAGQTAGLLPGIASGTRDSCPYGDFRGRVSLN